MYCGLDVGSTTCKYVLCAESGAILAQAYERHNAKQADMVWEFLGILEAQHGLTPHRDHIFCTGSGAGIIAPYIGARLVQEVVAVAAAVERLHPRRAVCERDWRRGYEDHLLAGKGRYEE